MTRHFGVLAVSLPDEITATAVMGRPLGASSFVRDNASSSDVKPGTEGPSQPFKPRSQSPSTLTRPPHAGALENAMKRKPWNARTHSKGDEGGGSRRAG